MEIIPDYTNKWYIYFDEFPYTVSSLKYFAGAFLNEPFFDRFYLLSRHGVGIIDGRPAWGFTWYVKGRDYGERPRGNFIWKWTFFVDVLYNNGQYPELSTVRLSKFPDGYGEAQVFSIQYLKELPSFDPALILN